MDQDNFFKDLKVVELANVLAGPAVGMFFAELGATVTKIENKRTGGDVTRGWKLPQEDSSSEYSAYYRSTNWNKRSIMLDLSQDDDQKQALELIANCDIVISNYRGQSAAKIGMDYPSLAKLNPDLIYGAITTYGEDDDSPGFDVMIQAETGWLFMNGEPGRNPVKLPVALMDILAAHQLKEGILLALMKRDRTRQGSKVSVSLFDAGISALANQASSWLNLGVIPQRRGSQHPNIAPYGDIFYSKDNKPLLLAVGTEKQFTTLCRCLKLDALSTNPNFASNAKRVANREELLSELTPVIKDLNLHDILSRFKDEGVPAAAILDMKEVFDSTLAQYNIIEDKSSTGKGARTVSTAVFRIE